MYERMKTLAKNDAIFDGVRKLLYRQLRSDTRGESNGGSKSGDRQCDHQSPVMTKTYSF